MDAAAKTLTGSYARSPHTVGSGQIENAAPWPSAFDEHEFVDAASRVADDAVKRTAINVDIRARQFGRN
jgi:hypothetical protein